MIDKKIFQKIAIFEYITLKLIWAYMQKKEIPTTIGFCANNNFGQKKIIMFLPNFIDACPKRYREEFYKIFNSFYVQEIYGLVEEDVQNSVLNGQTIFEYEKDLNPKLSDGKIIYISGSNMFSLPELIVIKRKELVWYKANQLTGIIDEVFTELGKINNNFMLLDGKSLSQLTKNKAGYAMFLNIYAESKTLIEPELLVPSRHPWCIDEELRSIT